MSSIRVTSTLGDLASDLDQIATEAKPAMARTLFDVAIEGQKLAREFAKASAGSHGKHYPNSITVERRGLLEVEYGPDSALPQGGMSFEYGSRNQPPHLDLNKSADIVGPKLGEKVLDAVDGLFWPGA